jgi:hypothetical protein
MATGRDNRAHRPRRRVGRGLRRSAGAPRDHELGGKLDVDRDPDIDCDLDLDRDLDLDLGRNLDPDSRLGPNRARSAIALPFPAHRRATPA